MYSKSICSLQQFIYSDLFSSKNCWLEEFLARNVSLIVSSNLLRPFLLFLVKISLSKFCRVYDPFTEFLLRLILFFVFLNCNH